MFYNSISMNRIQAFQLASAWFASISILSFLENDPGNIPSKYEPSVGNIYTADLYDDTGKTADKRRGKAVLRAGSTGGTESRRTGILQDLPTIELQYKNGLHHATEAFAKKYYDVRKVRFNFLDKDNDDRDKCFFKPQEEEERDFRKRAEREVAIAILLSKYVVPSKIPTVPRQQRNEPPSPSFKFPSFGIPPIPIPNPLDLFNFGDRPI